MKVKIECNSSLLQKSLEHFLKEYIDENGILITDNIEKDGIIIGKDIKKPFTKTSLILQLQKKVVPKKSFDEEFNEIFEEFKDKLLQTIKDHYGKR